ncbi:hypothetical protein TNCV_3801231 [Trichonephila clavipes]|nr:hypothetical protein TNCV_3801231 [Trichonephila clavipes]
MAQPRLKCERKLEKEAGKRKRVDLSVSSRKKKTQLSTSAENFSVDPENIFLPSKENESAFQKAYKAFNHPNNDSSLGIKEFLLLRKEETIFIFCNKLETYKALKVSKWVHCIYSKVTDARKMIKNVEFKTPNNEVLQETNLARLYDDMSEKIVKESEDLKVETRARRNLKTRSPHEPLFFIQRFIILHRGAEADR